MPDDQNTPGPQKQPFRATTGGALVAGGLAGTPIAVVIIWLIGLFLSHPMPAEVASALGSVIAAVTGTIWHIVQQLLAKKGIDV